MEDPTRHLVEPVPAEGTISEGYVNPIQILDLVSPAAWINEAIKSVTGHDVLESLVKPFAGDWESFSKFGSALDNLAPCMQDIGVNVQQGLETLDAAWDGRANDAAYLYFCDLASRVSGLQFALREAAANYEKTATGVWQLATQMANLLQSIVDQGIIIAVAAIAGTASFETGVGPLIGYGIAAWRAVELLKLINRAMIIVQTGGTAIMLFMSEIQQVNWRGGDVNDVPLPANPYHHPAIA